MAEVNKVKLGGRQVLAQLKKWNDETDYEKNCKFCAAPTRYQFNCTEATGKCSDGISGWICLKCAAKVIDSFNQNKIVPCPYNCSGYVVPKIYHTEHDGLSLEDDEYRGSKVKITKSKFYLNKLFTEVDIKSNYEVDIKSNSANKESITQEQISQAGRTLCAFIDNDIGNARLDCNNCGISTPYLYTCTEGLGEDCNCEAGGAGAMCPTCFDRDIYIPFTKGNLTKCPHECGGYILPTMQCATRSWEDIGKGASEINFKSIPDIIKYSITQFKEVEMPEPNIINKNTSNNNINNNNNTSKNGIDFGDNPPEWVIIEVYIPFFSKFYLIKAEPCQFNTKVSGSVYNEVCGSNPVVVI